jgi:hypothetical protein
VIDFVCGLGISDASYAFDVASAFGALESLNVDFKVAEFVNDRFVGQKVDVFDVVECAAGCAAFVDFFFVFWLDRVYSL